MTGERRAGGRRSIRLKGFDYASAGAYFLTLVAHKRQLIFGSIKDSRVVLSAAGEIVREEWTRTTTLRSEMMLDAIVIMPNHLHAVVWIRNERTVGATGRSPNDRPGKRTLGSFVAGFKGQTAARINRLRGTTGEPVWQRNYFERIVRNEREYEAICGYIDDNPSRWHEDAENPAAVNPSADRYVASLGDLPVAPTVRRL